jgi:hypothetical protein
MRVRGTRKKCGFEKAVELACGRNAVLSGHRLDNGFQIAGNFPSLAPCSSPKLA